MYDAEEVFYTGMGLVMALLILYGLAHPLAVFMSITVG